MILQFYICQQLFDLVSGHVVQVGQVGVVEHHLRKHSNHHLHSSMCLMMIIISGEQ